MHPRCCGVPPLPGYRLATSWVHYTTSCNTQCSATEDGRDQRPKHVELIGIINKQLLFHLVGVYIIHCTLFLAPHLRVFLPFDAIQSELLTDSVNNP